MQLIKRNNLILIVLLIFFKSYSQCNTCDTIKGKYYFKTFQLVSSGNYSIYMTGLSISSKLSTTAENFESFLSYFYSTNYYVPELALSDYRQAVIKCLGKESGRKFINIDPEYGVKLSNKIRDNATKQSITLKNGDIIVIWTTEINGSFWVINADNLSTNSNEWDIKKIMQIKKAYIPFELNEINIPQQ